MKKVFIFAMAMITGQSVQILEAYNKHSIYGTKNHPVYHYKGPDSAPNRVFSGCGHLYEKYSDCYKQCQEFGGRCISQKGDPKAEGVIKCNANGCHHNATK